VDANGSRKTPIVIHRAILGSFERFLGILIEHFGGAFPAWLAPVQAIVLPITNKQNKYAKTILAQLKELGIRVEMDDRNESIGKKIREAEMNKVPYMLIIGEKEEKARKVSIRGRNQKDHGSMKLEKFCEGLVAEILARK
jgi:threonyl-tRNA synthetase